MAHDPLSFPPIARRQNYLTTQRGTYYADYQTYRQEIREDCLGRCVYCDSHENETGGQESMQLDHFRPKKYPEFDHLKNDPNNLVWACCGCNRLKSSHWPALGTPDTVSGVEGFIDPFQDNRRAYFDILPNGELQSLKPPAGYKIRLLALNRPFKRRIREFRQIQQSWLKQLASEAQKIENLVEHDKTLSSDTERSLEDIALRLRRMHDKLAATFLDFSLH